MVANLKIYMYVNSLVQVAKFVTKICGEKSKFNVTPSHNLYRY